MQLQTVNRSDAEKVFVNVSNLGGATITANHSAFGLNGVINSLSMDINGAFAFQAGAANQGRVAARPATMWGSFIGLADEDIPNDSVGRVQVYGYKASGHIAHVHASGNVDAPGQVMGPINSSISIGVSSVGGFFDKYGPIVALDTVLAAAHAGGANGAFGNHVFLRVL